VESILHFGKFLYRQLPTPLEYAEDGARRSGDNPTVNSDGPTPFIFEKGTKLSDLFTYVNTVYIRDNYKYSKVPSKQFNSSKYKISKM
jgi:hypothetical protein